MSHSEFGFARVSSVLSPSVKFSMHFIAFSGQMHRDREEGASSALLCKRASRCQHVSSLSRLSKTILAHYSVMNLVHSNKSQLVSFND